MTPSEERGQMTQCKNPVWEPLLNLASEHVDDFMWMCEVKLESGARLHAYKHYWTRRYLHLGEDGRAFVYREPDRYRQISPCRLLQSVLPTEDTE
jgi:hypothetical protein